jgi:hypothetical protein
MPGKKTNSDNARLTQKTRVKPVIDTPISNLLSADAKALIISNGGLEYVRKIGLDAIREVILNVFLGHNIREATESLTRRRIAAMNLETVNLFLKGQANDQDFTENLPNLAVNHLTGRQKDNIEVILSRWVIGLTGKSVQNVLRSNKEAYARYRDGFIEDCNFVSQAHSKLYGELKGSFKVGEVTYPEVDWLWLTYLLNAIGAQTLTIRGSDKSIYGKLFEKLVLGSLLHILGFKLSVDQQATPSAFWLSSRADKRESDATLVYDLGKLVRFDIGFIGPGNSEISLDKVSRFERYLELSGTNYFVNTFIIVDRIGEKSRTATLAREIGGELVQMSWSFWPKIVAEELHQTFREIGGFNHELLNLQDTEIEGYLREKLKEVPIESFINFIPTTELAKQTIENLEEDLDS